MMPNAFNLLKQGAKKRRSPSPRSQYVDETFGKGSMSSYAEETPAYASKEKKASPVKKNDSSHKKQNKKRSKKNKKKSENGEDKPKEGSNDPKFETQMNTSMKAKSEQSGNPEVNVGFEQEGMKLTFVTKLPSNASNEEIDKQRESSAAVLVKTVKSLSNSNLKKEGTKKTEESEDNKNVVEKKKSEETKKPEETSKEGEKKEDKDKDPGDDANPDPGLFGLPGGF